MIIRSLSSCKEVSLASKSRHNGCCVFNGAQPNVHAVRHAPAIKWLTICAQWRITVLRGGGRNYFRLPATANATKPRINTKIPARTMSRGLRVVPVHSPVANPQMFEVMMMDDINSGQPRMGPIARRCEAE